jgi:GNAT superfamily N-acetyltransferase
MAESADRFEVHELDVARWGDFERLFESRGAPKYCWCMAWRATPEERGVPGSERKPLMRARVEAGVPVGLLGYLDGEPSAWCSVAPRPTHRKLEPGQNDDPTIWSVTCFFVPRALRGQGLSRRLLEAALEHARRSGAKVVEAYPVDPDSPSYRFMGFRSLYEAAGFEEVGRAGERRRVVRKVLSS